jgi:ABC-type transport system involved in multi-copper enzyme maturation permease subunit
MLKVLIRKELLEILLSFKFVVTFAISTLTIISSLVLGAVDYQADLQQFDTSRTLNRANLEKQSSWRALGLQGVQLAQPPTPLAVLSSGLQRSSGKVFGFSTRDLPHAEGTELSEAPILSLFGDLDPTFIVGVILSLFALLFSYDSISGEKETGTLKLVLSNSVPRDTILLGKLVGGFLSVLIALAVPLVVGILVALLFFPLELDGGEWMRLALIFLTYVLFLLSLYTLGLLVSTRTGRPLVSFLVCLLVWVIFVNIFPKSAILVARRVSPVPSIHETTAQHLALTTEYGQRATEIALEMSRAVNRGEVSIDDYGRESARRMAELDDEFSRRGYSYQEFVRQKRRSMLRWAMNLSRLSPLSAMRYATMNLAGTGLDREARFLRALDGYRSEFVRFVEAGAAGENVAARVFTSEPPKPLDLAGMPEFRFAEERLGPALERALPDLGILLLYSVVFFVLGFVSFRHYDPC